MDLRALETLLAVVQHGGFSAAARATHTVQSNVSAHIARLETELDTVLIDRSTGTPTQEGEAVVARARRIQIELAALEADVASIKGTPRGIVRVGVIGTTARWLVPLLASHLRNLAPLVELVVSDGSADGIADRVRSGELDIGVVGLPVNQDDLSVLSLFDEDHSVVAPAGHPLAKLSSPIDLAKLAEHDLILAARGTAFRTDIDTRFAAHGLEPKVSLEVDGIRLLASLAFQGFGVAIVPATAAPDIAGGQWCRIRVNDLGQREVGLVRRRRGLPSVADQATVQVIQGIVRTESTTLPGLFGKC